MAAGIRPAGRGTGAGRAGVSRNRGLAGAVRQIGGKFSSTLPMLFCLHLAIFAACANAGELLQYGQTACPSWDLLYTYGFASNADFRGEACIPATVAPLPAGRTSNVMSIRFTCREPAGSGISASIYTGAGCTGSPMPHLWDAANLALLTAMECGSTESVPRYGFELLGSATLPACGTTGSVADPLNSGTAANSGAGASSGAASEQPAECPQDSFEMPDIAPSMCEVCAPPPLTATERCMYDDSECMATEPGACCAMGCRAPYVGSTVTLCCPAFNEQPGQRMLNFSFPSCECPQPPPTEGYMVDAGSPTGWACTPGTHVGTPVVNCMPDPNTFNFGCPRVISWLSGCDVLVPCAYPALDPCRYDTSACTSVQAGGSCQITCKPPFNPGVTTATCPSNNIDPDHELSLYPLRCILTNCEDPVPLPPGYIRNPAGEWVCASGWSGSVTATCSPSQDWAPGATQQDCSAVVTLEGCQEIVPCQAPILAGLEACEFDLASCLSVAPGSTCQVFCKDPFVGAATTASCSATNTDPAGLDWIRPECNLNTCNDPPNIPAGYMRSTLTSNGWECAQSYTGVAEKTCTVTPQCAAIPVLAGCSQLTPCKASALEDMNSCMFDFYGCASVQPGAVCQVRCKAPFAGSVTTAECPQGNTAESGLLWTPPVCLSSDCTDPNPYPAGYIKRGSGATAVWECSEGYAGTVNVTCTWNAANCQYDAQLSGCFPEEPCVLPTLSQEAACKVNFTACPAGVSSGGNLASGAGCTLTCRTPFMPGSSLGRVSCLAGNLQPGRLAEFKEPTCSCPDPTLPPLGYVKNLNTGEWQCDTGYAGIARKMCLPAGQQTQGQPCNIQAMLHGCGVPLPCDVGPWVDLGSGRGHLYGTVQFGRAVMLSSINETHVVDYRLYFADDCNRSIGEPIAILNKSFQDVSCCRSDTYTFSVDHALVPTGMRRLMIRAGLFYGDSIGYRLIEPGVSTGMALPTSTARRRALWSGTALVLVTVAWIREVQTLDFS